MSRPPFPGPPQTANRSTWRRPVLLFSLFLTAIAAALAVTAISATQLTERNTAQRLLAAATRSLLEVDRFVEGAWPVLERKAPEGAPITLVGFPIGLQIDPTLVEEGPESVSTEVVAATASLVYDDGFEVLADSPQAFRFLSRGAAFDGSVGRLTRGGHSIATIALIVTGMLAILLAMSVAAQARGLSRFAAPALAISVGAAVVWIAGSLLQSSLSGRAETTLDPFISDLWWIAVDALDILLRNSAIVALTAGALVGASGLAGLLLRTFDPVERA
ncbi:MAG: hypothetical protein F4Z51_02830 [Chloroflexi bacterium]|nr:hypothetical protein [Chloroflexota bacterium]MYD16760.1 hypothetical protein [Chloroflexota bacterium]MYJ01160.1 hypothetical protein [Chloroflexota bacterium]